MENPITDYSLPNTNISSLSSTILAHWTYEEISK